MPPATSASTFLPFARQPVPPPWAVVGVTAWGLTLAQRLSANGAAVLVLCRDAAEASALSTTRTQPARAPQVRLPAVVEATADPGRVAGAGAVLLAVPA